MPVARVAEAPQADCRVAQIVASPSVSRPVVQAPMTRSISRSPWVDAHPSAAQPNYILQDEEEDNDPTPEQQTTRSAAWSIMQEAMLACVDIYRLEYILSEDLCIVNYTLNPTKPNAKFMVTPQQMSMQRLLMTWLCEMANPVIGEGGELLKYKHLIANPKTQAKWTHSYGNKIGRLAQHTRSKHRHKHHHLHQEGSGTKGESQGHDLWPHHMHCLT